MKNEKMNIKNMEARAEVLAIASQKQLKGGGDPPPIGGVLTPIGENPPPPPPPKPWWHIW